MIVKRWVFIYISLTTIILLLTVVGCSIAGQPASSGAGGVANPIAVTVELSKYPKLYEPVKVTATIEARHYVDVPGAEAWLRIPYQAIYVDGDLTWKGDLVLDQPVQFSATLVFVKEGGASVGASVWAPPPPNSGWVGMGGGNHVSLFVGKDSGRPAVYRGPLTQTLTPPEIERLGIGVLFLQDKSRLLNTSDQPRFLLIDSRERLAQLQQEGLVPQELAFQWRGVAEIDFDKYLLIAAYDRARPDSASNIRIIEDVALEHTTRLIKVPVESADIPPHVARASRPTSAVHIVRMHRSTLPFLGEQAFDFSLNGEVVDRVFIVVDELVPTATPRPTREPSRKERERGNR